VGGSPLRGKTITFTLTEQGTVQTAGTATTDAHGVATVTGVSLGSLSAGTYPGAISASFDGDASDAASTASGDLTIARATSILAVKVASGTYGTTATFAATLTAAGVPLAREPVTFFTVTASGHTITLGTASTDAHGFASVSGVSLGSVPAGTYTGAVFASFAGDANDAATTGQGDLIISQATPAVTWAKPTDITQGRALGPAQLDAKASVPGTFAYSPPAGTVLPAGMGQTLAAVFTPADAVDYKSVNVTTTLNVLPTSTPTPTALKVAPVAGTYGSTATLTALLTAGFSRLAGEKVTFTLTEGSTVQAVGTATTDANGVASLTGVSLANLSAGTYSSAIGASFAGDSAYASSRASGTLVVNGSSQSPPVIVGEQPLFHRNTNKKGKPIGPPVLSGFVFDFSEALIPATATNARNYQVDTITTKRVKKQTRRILNPMTGFSVAYNAANDSVTLTFAGKQTFRTGGQITVVGGPPSGVTGVSGAALAGRKVFTISPGGQSIVGQ
jgi:hypothetical protein